MWFKSQTDLLCNLAVLAYHPVCRYIYSGNPGYWKCLPKDVDTFAYFGPLIVFFDPGNLFNRPVTIGNRFPIKFRIVAVPKLLKKLFRSAEKDHFHWKSSPKLVSGRSQTQRAPLVLLYKSGDAPPDFFGPKNYFRGKIFKIALGVFGRPLRTSFPP